jgi:hypothetical protein
MGLQTVTDRIMDCEILMDIDEQKVDEFSLALLYLTTSKDKFGFRAWKGQSWDVLDRLHESGYIDDPRSKAKSVLLTDEGVKRSKALFEKHFAK